jgi:hypothetical protein
MKEVNQLHDKGVWTLAKYDDIENKCKIIRSLVSFIFKIKKEWHVTCCGHEVSIHAVGSIFAAEKRQVATFDIEGAFLHGVTTNDIYMEISGQCVV